MVPSPEAWEDKRTQSALWDRLRPVVGERCKRIFSKRAIAVWMMELDSGQEIAVKAIDLADDRGGRSVQLKREAAMSARVRGNPLLASMQGWYHDEAVGCLFSVMPYGGRSLQDWLDDGTIPELSLAGRVACARFALAHMLTGLQAMHGVAHQDLRPDNVFMSRRWACVGDLGGADPEAGGRHTLVAVDHLDVSLAFLNEHGWALWFDDNAHRIPVGVSKDVFMAGFCVLKIVAGRHWPHKLTGNIDPDDDNAMAAFLTLLRHLFTSLQHGSTQFRELQGVYDRLQEQHPDCMQALQLLCRPHPADRPSVQQALQLPFIADELDTIQAAMQHMTARAWRELEAVMVVLQDVPGIQWPWVPNAAAYSSVHTAVMAAVKEVAAAEEAEEEAASRDGGSSVSTSTSNGTGSCSGSSSSSQAASSDGISSIASSVAGSNTDLQAASTCGTKQAVELAVPQEAESQEPLALVCCKPTGASELAQQCRQVQAQEQSGTAALKQATQGAGGISGAQHLRLLQRLQVQSEGSVAPCTPQVAAEGRRVSSSSSPRAFDGSDGGEGADDGGSASNSDGSSSAAVSGVVQSEPQLVAACAAAAVAPVARHQHQQQQDGKPCKATRRRGFMAALKRLGAKLLWPAGAAVQQPAGVGCSVRLAALLGCGRAQPLM